MIDGLFSSGILLCDIAGAGVWGDGKGARGGYTNCIQIGVVAVPVLDKSFQLGI